MKSYFITGTDTDCGKTYVTAQLLRVLKNAKAIKPIASGCVWADGQWVNNDVQILQECTQLSAEIINPWCFKEPIAPHLAAQKQGIMLSAHVLADYCKNINLSHRDTLLIEGAGGLMVPLNDKETWVDFLEYTQIPVILVVGMKLGCINHALLTQSALEAAGISCVGWIANCLDNEMLELDANIDTLKNKLKYPLIAILPYCGSLEERTVMELFNPDHS